MAIDDLDDMLIRFVFSSVLFRNGMLGWDEFTAEMQLIFGPGVGDEVAAAVDRQNARPTGR